MLYVYVLCVRNMVHGEKTVMNVSIVMLVFVHHLVLNDTAKKNFSKYYSTCNISFAYSDILPLVVLYAFCDIYLHASMNEDVLFSIEKHNYKINP